MLPYCWPSVAMRANTARDEVESRNKIRAGDPVDVPAGHAVLFAKGFRDNEDYDRADQTASEEHVEERIAGGRDGQE